VAYESYKKKFLTLNNLIPLFFILAICGIGTYYNFTYLILMTLFIIKSKNNLLRLLGLVTLALFFPFWQLILVARTQVLGHFFGFLTIIGLFLLTSKIQNKHKVLIVVIFLSIVSLVLFKFRNDGRVRTLLTPQVIVQRIQEWDKFIQTEKKNYVKTEIPIKLYNPEREVDIPGLRIMPKKEEGAQSAMIVELPSDTNEETIKYIESKKGSLKYLHSNKTCKNSSTKKITQCLPPSNLSQNQPTFTSGKSKIMATLPKDTEVLVELTKRKINTNPPVKLLAKGNFNEEQSYNQAIFRLLVWRDMLRELFNEKAIFGFNFGKPLRSESIEITGMAYGEWTRDGWVAAHNSYLEVIYRSGLIGVALIVIMFVVLFQLIVLFVRRKSLTGIFLISIIVYWLAVASVYVTFELPYSAISFWTFFGFASAYGREIIKEKV